MKALFKICVLPLTLAVVGCSTSPKAPTVITNPTTAIQATYPTLPPAKDMIRLKEGQTVVSENKAVAVTFNKVLSDDRCPMDTQCIWAGNATVDLTVKDKDGKAQALKLASGDLRGDLKRRATVFGQTISLETVYPTPHSSTDKQDLTGHYLIYVKVTPAS